MSLRRRSGDQGTAVVEFGVIFPVIALLIGGMVAFGLAYDIQLTLQQAAREGVRAYALGSGDPEAVAHAASSTVGAVAVETSGNCEDPANQGDPAPQAHVIVSYDFEIGVPWISDELDGPDGDGRIEVTLSSKAVMRCGG